MDGALESLHAIFGLARLLSQEPHVWAQHQRTGWISHGLAGVESLLTAGSSTKPQLQRMMAMLRQVEAQELDGKRWVRAWIGQRYLAIRLHDGSGAINPWGGGPTPPALQLLVGVQSLLGFADHSLLRTLRVMNAQLGALNHPFPENVRRFNVQQGTAGFGLFGSRNSGWLTWVTQNVRDGIEMDQVNINRIRLAEIAVAIELARLNTNTIPEDLKSLAPAFIEAVPEPLGQSQPFTFERLTPGYRVFLGTNAPAIKSKEKSRWWQPIGPIITIGR